MVSEFNVFNDTEINIMIRNYNGINMIFTTVFLHYLQTLYLIGHKILIVILYVTCHAYQKL